MRNCILCGVFIFLPASVRLSPFSLSCWSSLVFYFTLQTGKTNHRGNRFRPVPSIDKVQPIRSIVQALFAVLLQMFSDPQWSVRLSLWLACKHTTRGASACPCQLNGVDDKLKQTMCPRKRREESGPDGQYFSLCACRAAGKFNMFVSFYLISKKKKKPH